MGSNFDTWPPFKLLWELCTVRTMQGETGAHSILGRYALPSPRVSGISECLSRERRRPGVTTGLQFPKNHQADESTIFQDRTYLPPKFPIPCRQSHLGGLFFLSNYIAT